MGSSASAGFRAQLPPPNVMAHVDLSRYSKVVWHEIARLPNWFQQRNTFGRATYSLDKFTNRLSVLNETMSVLTRSVTGDSISGYAELVVPAHTSKLRVCFRFLGSFYGPWADYWILFVNNSYTLAVVGTPDRKTLWIMAADRSDVDYSQFISAIERCKNDGFKTDALLYSIHTPFY